MFIKRNHEKKNVTPVQTLTIYGVDGILFSGSLSELPITEDMILAKSREFFDDPEPCMIHRNAVRIRLLAELERAIPETPDEDSSEWLSLLSEVTGFTVLKALLN